MKKFILFLLSAILAVAIIGGAGYAVYNWLNKTTEPAETKTAKQYVDPVEKAAQKYSVDEVASMYKAGGDNRCSYTGDKFKTTVYFSKSKLFINLEPSDSSPSFSLLRDGSRYDWSPVKAEGTKEAVTPEDQAAALKSAFVENDTDAATTKISCIAWTPDESYFTLPAAYKFQ